MTGDKRNMYDKYYRFILIVPAILLLLSVIYLVQFSIANDGDLVRKDVSLTGGTTITVFDSGVDITSLRNDLSPQFPDIKVRAISDILTGNQQAFFVETRADVGDIRPALESYLGYELDNENSSIEFSGATLSQGFYRQLIGAIVAAFLLMALVVFFVFGASDKMKAISLMVTGLALGFVLPGIGIIRTVAFLTIIGGFVFGAWKSAKTRNDYILLASVGLASFLLLYFSVFPLLITIAAGIALLGIYTVYSVPSIAIVVAAFANIVLTVTTINLIGLELSAAGIVAILMLIGYSVDSNILLTSRMIRKREGSVNERIVGAFKTGMTMIVTSMVAIGIALLLTYSFSDILRQIFTILFIGLAFDVLNTWTTNTSLIKWYVEAKK
jgi:preprotein translocase subunit SecF